MSSRHARWVSVLGSFLTVTVLGSAGCSTAPGRASRTVVVENLGQGTTQDILISKEKGETLDFPFPAGITIDHLEITLRPGQNLPHPSWPPFKKCDANPSVCSIACDAKHRGCKTGRIHPDLDPPPGGIAYDCAFIPATGEPSDPGIRILP